MLFRKKKKAYPHPEHIHGFDYKKDELNPTCICGMTSANYTYELMTSNRNDEMIELACKIYPGWAWIIEDAHKQLSYLDPTYSLEQVKEKFGTLRYYFEPSEGIYDEDPMRAKIMFDLVSYAELMSSSNCEKCPSNSHFGNQYVKIDKTVKLRGGGWYRTLCDTCAGETKEA